MPSAPLIDFDAVDLSQVVIGPDEIRELCLQRNRFAMLDGILHFDLENDFAIGFKDLAPDDWWVPDHIPGRPIFPGVLQIEGAAQLCSYHFLRKHPHLQHRFVGFGGVNETRFRGIVAPPGRIVYAAKPIRVRSIMFTYQTQGFVDGKLVLESEIIGVIL